MAFLLRQGRWPWKIRARTFWRGGMTVVIPEYVSMAIYRYGFFEEELSWAILYLLKPGMTFIDIGAHFGYFTLLSSLLVSDRGQVHSFEPTPSSFRILSHNVKAKKNIRLQQKAVFSENTTVCLNDYGIKYAASNSIYEPRLSPGRRARLIAKRCWVPSVTFDTYLSETAIHPDFIKIDAESAEMEILKGMEKTLQEFHPILSLEVGGYQVDGAAKVDQLIHHLENRGYKAFRIAKKEFRAAPESSSWAEDENLIFIAK